MSTTKSPAYTAPEVGSTLWDCGTLLDVPRSYTVLESGAPGWLRLQSGDTGESRPSFNNHYLKRTYEEARAVCVERLERKIARLRVALQSLRV